MLNSMQKMREYFKAIVKNANDALKYRHDGLDYGDLQGIIEEIKEDAESALAVPLRNCDVGTATEQGKRFEDFCFTHRTKERCCQDCPLLHEACCELGWAQMPYEGGEER